MQRIGLSRSALAVRGVEIAVAVVDYLGEEGEQLLRVAPIGMRAPPHGRVGTQPVNECFYATGWPAEGVSEVQPVFAQEVSLERPVELVYETDEAKGRCTPYLAMTPSMRTLRSSVERPASRMAS